MIDQPLPVAAALAGIGDALALAREAAGDDRRRSAEPDADSAAPRRSPRARRAVAGDAPATPEAWAARLDELAAHARTLSRRRRGAHRGARRGSGQRARDVGRGGPADRRAAIAATSRCCARCRRRTSLRRRIAELADPPVGEPTATCRPAAATLVRRLQAIADQAERLVQEMDFGFLFDPIRKLFSIGFRVRDGALDPSYYDLLASEARLDQLRRDRQGRRRRRTTGSGSAGADTGRPRLRADLVVRLDVRVPDARARDARPGQQPARADVPPGRRPPDPLRGRARRAVGHLRVRLQRPRPRRRRTSTRASACPASASSAGSARTWSSRRTRPRWRR